MCEVVLCAKRSHQMITCHFLSLLGSALRGWKIEFIDIEVVYY